jgi:hypothetical protein
MAKCWMSVAVVAFVVGGTALGQDPYLPIGQNKPAMMPEPIPCFASPQGMMPPQAAAAPDSPNSLPGDASNAWSDEYCPSCATYFDLGYLAMAREKLHRRPVAILDSSNVRNGIPDPVGQPVLDFHDIDPRFMQGVKATLGVHWDAYAFEVAGFHLAQDSSSKAVLNAGRVDTFFNVNGVVGPGAFPLGFEGENGLTIHDDAIKAHLKTALSSGEANFRWWPTYCGDMNWLVGVRYLDLYERAGIFIGNDVTTVDVNGRPNPVLQADYNATAHNRILGGQLGWEWTKPVTCWLAWTALVKGAWGPNFLDRDTRLTRGDGFPGPAGRATETNFSQLYEAGFYLDFFLTDNIHLRAGYNLLWIADVTNASDVLDFNLANTSGGRHDPHGSEMYHGPQVEFQFLF